MTETRPASVLVVDDSAFARKVVRDILSGTPGVEVVGSARDGLEALEKIAELSPDVVTLDLMMPDLDGLGVLRALPEESRPAIVLVTTSAGDSELVVEALQLGAVDVVTKPTNLATDRLYEMGHELGRKVRAGAHARPVRRGAAKPAPHARARVDTELVVIAASTGGPQALTGLVTSLPESFPAALGIALHIPAEYTAAFARRLDEASAIEVVEASPGVELRPGRAVVARGGMHLAVERRGGALVAALTRTPHSLYYPSADVLFSSAARACGAGVLGVVLTGMGDDGLAGSRALRAAGGRILTQTEASCVVYGMPRAVREAGLSSGEIDLEDAAAAIVNAL